MRASHLAIMSSKAPRESNPNWAMPSLDQSLVDYCANDVGITSAFLTAILNPRTTNIQPSGAAAASAAVAAAAAAYTASIATETAERQLRGGISGAGTAGAGAIVGDEAAAVGHLLHPLVSVAGGWWRLAPICQSSLFTF